MSNFDNLSETILTSDRTEDNIELFAESEVAFTYFEGDDDKWIGSSGKVA